jgi:hypothetical protein
MTTTTQKKYSMITKRNRSVPRLIIIQFLLLNLYIFLTSALETGQNSCLPRNFKHDSIFFKVSISYFLIFKIHHNKNPLSIAGVSLIYRHGSVPKT